MCPLTVTTRFSWIVCISLCTFKFTLSSHCEPHFSHLSWFTITGRRFISIGALLFIDMQRFFMTRQLQTGNYFFVGLHSLTFARKWTLVRISFSIFNNFLGVFFYLDCALVVVVLWPFSPEHKSHNPSYRLLKTKSHVCWWKPKSPEESELVEDCCEEGEEEEASKDGEDEDPQGDRARLWGLQG